TRAPEGRNAYQNPSPIDGDTDERRATASYIARRGFHASQRRKHSYPAFRQVATLGSDRHRRRDAWHAVPDPALRRACVPVLGMDPWGPVEHLRARQSLD